MTTASKTTPLDEEGDEIQSEVTDLERYANDLKSAISDASSCDTLEDLVANLDAAKDAFDFIKGDLNTLLKRAKKELALAKSEAKSKDD